MKRFFDKVAKNLDKLDVDSVRGQFKGLANEFAFLEAVFRALGEGIIVASAEGALAYANPAGWDWDDLLAPARSASDWTRAALREIEITYPEHRILEVQSMPNGDATIVILRDVTQAHAREADAVESGQIAAIQQLASGVAH
ncbi:MAG: hypothetical protein MJ249_16835, partial [Kiritimatiellae bacterium]|nr:hypothetical protein [Kiritimatiellia bacterium]